MVLLKGVSNREFELSCIITRVSLQASLAQLVRQGVFCFVMEVTCSQGSFSRLKRPVKEHVTW